MGMQLHLLLTCKGDCKQVRKLNAVHTLHDFMSNINVNM